MIKEYKDDWKGGPGWKLELWLRQQGQKLDIFFQIHRNAEILWWGYALIFRFQHGTMVPSANICVKSLLGDEINNT